MKISKKELIEGYKKNRKRDLEILKEWEVLTI